MSNNKDSKQAQASAPNKKQNTDEKQAQQGNNQVSTGSISLSQGQQQKADELEQQITKIEQQLQHMSNSELKAVSDKLDTVERAMLLEKIDNQLHTMKDTIVKPGDGTSTPAAGSEVAVAVTAQTPQG